MILRLVLFAVGLVLLFTVRAAKYGNSADFSPVLLFGAFGWFVVLALSLLPGLDSTKAQAKAAMSRTALFGGMSGVLLWASLWLGGTAGSPHVIGNLLILVEFVVGYAVVGLLISIPSALLRKR